MKRANVKKSRHLRINQTDAERKLWSLLRSRQVSGAKFRRQFAIGKRIMDFYCPEYGIGIEADGGQHYEEKGRKLDAVRMGELSKLGVEIIRFSDREILTDIESVGELIYRVVEAKKKSPLTPTLSPMGRGSNEQ